MRTALNISRCSCRSVTKCKSQCTRPTVLQLKTSVKTKQEKIKLSLTSFVYLPCCSSNIHRFWFRPEKEFLCSSAYLSFSARPWLKMDGMLSTNLPHLHVLCCFEGDIWYLSFPFPYIFLNFRKKTLL